jgi:site-specific DNA-methyltransferase (adenine-specific)
MNRLYFGDNLYILREHVPDESVDLIYLDPPFNSNRSYNVLFKEKNGTAADAQIEAFDDTWSWGRMAQDTLREIEMTAPARVVTVTHALYDLVGQNDMMAYLVMMTIRMVELYRVLKPTGSIYLHCDPTASHYLKIVMDAVFGKENFVNEIIWERTTSHSDAKRWSPVSDSLLYYAKIQERIWNPQHEEYDEAYIKSKYRHQDPDGRRFQLHDMTSPNPRPNMMYEWKGFPSPAKGWRFSRETMERLDAEGRIWYPDSRDRRPRIKRYLDEMSGKLVGNIWKDIPPINSQAKERLGYPTQKPEALLERIIRASSNEGDLVLDPFCGCGTAVVAAEKLGRRWIGIDITHLAIALMRQRMDDTFGDKVTYEVVGVPADVPSARALAEQDPYQFEWWAVGHIKARPAQQKKRGADSGIDGLLFFVDEADEKAKKVMVQVKSGRVSVNQIRDLCHTVERENAVMGFFITLENPTRPMEREALGAGYYHSPGWNRDYHKIQIRTVDQLFSGQGFDHPPTNVTYDRAQRVKPKEAVNGKLL